MCCLFAVLIFLGPRVAGVLWWLVESTRWTAAFNGNLLLPILGLVFLPWVTLMFVLVGAGPEGIQGFDWVWLGLALVGDVAGYAGGAKNKNSIPGMPSS